MSISPVLLSLAALFGAEAPVCGDNPSPGKHPVEAPARPPASASLWGDVNLIAAPKPQRGDVVHILVPAEAEGGRPLKLAARVVKVLPNGNVLLEARIEIGEGRLTLSGEVAGGDIAAGAHVPLSAMAGLKAVVSGDFLEEAERLLLAAAGAGS